MAIKRILGRNSEKFKTCLNCGKPIEMRLKDDYEYRCRHCGQEHYVDIYENSIALTKAEYPHLRKRHSGNETELQQRRNLEEFVRKVEALRREEQQHIENKESSCIRFPMKEE